MANFLKVTLRFFLIIPFLFLFGVRGLLKGYLPPIFELVSHFVLALFVFRDPFGDKIFVICRDFTNI